MRIGQFSYVIWDWLSAVPDFRPDLHVMARNLHANMMKAGAPGNVIAQIVLPVEFRADLPENRCDCVLLRDINCAATADLGQGFQCVGINEDRRTDRHEIEQNGRFLYFLNDTGM